MLRSVAEWLECLNVSIYVHTVFHYTASLLPLTLLRHLSFLPVYIDLLLSKHAVNAEVVKVLGSIPASSDTVESEWRQTK
jgi:hypothetical protein